MNRKPNFLNVLVSVLVGMTLLLSAAQPNLVSASTELGDGDGVRTSVHPQTGKLSFLGADPSSPIRVDTAMRADLSAEGRGMAILDRYGPQFGLKNPQEELRLTSTREAEGRGTTKYQQLYQGIPVMAGELIVNTNGQGGLLSINGEVSPDLRISVTPSIDAMQAQTITLREVAEIYNLQISELVASVPELWVYDARLMNGEDTMPPHLVWRIEITSDVMPLRELTLVDAQTGKISLHFNQIDTAWANEVRPDEYAAESQFVRSPDHGTELPIGIPDPSLDRFVAATGNDNGGSNDCSDVANPCATINQAVIQSVDGDIIGVAEGVYTGTGSEVVYIYQKSVKLLGGWNASYDTQVGYSTVDGEFSRVGIMIPFVGIPGPKVTIDRFIVENGYARDGSGINNGSNLILSRSIIRNNNAIISDSTGSAIYNFDESMQIVDSAIYNNKGHGVYFESLMTPSRSVKISNSTISQNTGIGVGVSSFVPATIISSTIGDNGRVGLSKGTGWNTSVKLQNSIVANNDKSYSKQDCFGKIVSLGFNLIRSTEGCTISATTGDQFNVDPQLGVVVPSYGFHPLLALSPAIDAGNGSSCPVKDQRGVDRVNCDIGAYEYTVPGAAKYLYLIEGDAQHVGPMKNFDPFVALVVDAIGSPVQGVPVRFTAPLSGASGTFSQTGTNTMVVKTSASGIASSSRFIANDQTGIFPVKAIVSSIGSLVYNLRIEVWYVSTFGNDSNDCRSPSEPCKTLAGVIYRDDFTDLSSVWITNETQELGEFPISLMHSVELIGGWDATFTNNIGITKMLGRFEIRDGAVVTLSHFSLLPSTMGYQPPIREGISVDHGYLTILDSIVQGYSLAINSYHSVVTISNSTIRNNKGGTTYGAGIVATYGTLTVINTTITNNGNPNSTVGAGIYSYVNETFINNSTIARNTGKEGGGIYGNVSLANTIVVGNRATLGPLHGPDCTGVLVSRGNNLIGNIGKLGVSDAYPCRADWLGSDILGDHANPILATDVLADTLSQAPITGQYYYPLRVGSLAIDRGSTAFPGSSDAACLWKDQIGVARPLGRYCDIGAVEYDFPSSPPLALVVTYSADNSSSLAKTLICQSNDGNCPTGDLHAKKAHEYAFSAFQWFQTWHGRNSFDDHGMQINSSVHFSSQYKNAFWNGHMLVYGDGYGFPLADDVVAHEFTHGVTQYASNLFYWYQSGAISESLSDLWGEAIDQANGLGNDAASVKWFIGEGVNGLGAIRNMSDPTEFQDPDSMISSHYCKNGDCLNDNGGVHTNSGVNNKAVYLLVDGGTFNGKTVKPLGWKKTLVIYYEAQINLLTSGSDYLDLYNALYQACLNKINISGIGQADCREVRNASIAVKMRLQPAKNFNPDVSLCPSGSHPVVPEVFVEDFESGLDEWILGSVESEVAWGHSGSNAKSGQYSLWADDSYGFSDSFAISDEIRIPAKSIVFMHFSHAYAFETVGQVYYDGGILEYSVDSGQTWVDSEPLFSAGESYSGLISEDYGNPLNNNRAFVGDSHGYVDSRYDLSSLAGKTVQFRWQIGTDQIYSVTGWYIDDVRVYRCVSIPAVPILSAPANNANITDTTPTFNWSDSKPDLHHYELQIAKNSAFTQGVVKYNNIAVSIFTPTTALTPGTYYWRVRAFNAAGKFSAWSVVWKFTIQ
ncbi:MAG: M4 family metallopeptidase [Chloroflexi bacterium]|nr:M4 family metallopeptidase [Chloroflexota bacterium]